MKKISSHKDIKYNGYQRCQHQHTQMLYITKYHPVYRLPQLFKIFHSLSLPDVLVLFILAASHFLDQSLIFL